MATNEAGLNGKRKADTELPVDPTRNVRSKTAPPPALKEFEYQFKVLTNVPTQLPFFAETAQSIIDLYAVQVPLTQTALAPLVQFLQDQGADETKVQAACTIWQNNVDLSTLRQIGARCGTSEAVKEALHALILGFGDVPQSQITDQVQARLNASIRASLQETGSNAGASRMEAEQQVVGQPSKPRGQKEPQRAFDDEPRHKHREITGVSEAIHKPTGQPKAPEQAQLQATSGYDQDRNTEGRRPLLSMPGSATIQQTLGPGEKLNLSRSTPANGLGESRGGPSALHKSAQEQNTTISESVDQDALNQLIAESSQHFKQERDPLSLLEATLNGENQKQPTDLKKEKEPELKIKDRATGRPMGGSLPPTPLSATPTKALQHASAVEGRSGFHPFTRTNSSPEDKADDNRRDHSPIRRDPDRRGSWHIDSYRPNDFTNAWSDPLDVSLADRISGREAPKADPPYLPQNKMTCYFWFCQGSCSRGHRCSFLHELSDYVAEYISGYGKPHNIPLRIIQMDTMEATREATLANARSRKAPPMPDTPHELFPKHRVPLSDTPIVDELWGATAITLGLRNSAISTIIKHIKERHGHSPREFVTELYDENGKMSNYDLSTNSGLHSKLMGLFNQAPTSFDPQAVRLRMEDMLRPFLVANKSKFLDFPHHAFSTTKPDEREHLKSIREPIHKNWSQTFHRSPPAREL
ncbi:hypothetical protein NA57DRAFT_61386 [Rhizodiscina lignyota]|uniref:C3H1-type domain-containing protein n=1 Tax=Rhizodiscina lignyota TaxID=1504668 RepID=A0A9P4I288_9PEZI|nr:hypothetical protein NA57DRAFT_61386 [Rhizodiscina lignyota]